MFGDKLIVLRTVPIKKTDGTTVTNKWGQTVHTEVPCKISYKDRDSVVNVNEINNPIQRDVLIHLPLRYEVLSGDKLVATRKFPEDGRTETVTGIANKPNLFDTHQEVLLNDVEYS